MKINKRLTAFIIVLSFFLINYFLIPRYNVLCISNRKNPNNKFYSENAYNLGFIISYTHSVNKGRVHDYYKIDKKTGELIMTDTHFVSYGAGIPEPEETEGAEFEVLDNGYIIKNINRSVQKLTMAVGLIANHTISICYKDGDCFGEITSEDKFTNYFEPQTSLILESKKINLIEYWLHRYPKE